MKIMFIIETDSTGTTVSAKRGMGKGKSGIVYGKWHSKPQALRYLALHCLGAAGGYEFNPDRGELDCQIEAMKMENQR